MATKVEFKRVETDAEVENIDIKDGQLIYTGTGKTFMDYGNERIPTGSGGGSEVVISDEQPSGDEWKLWIDSDEVENSGSEIVDEYSESKKVGYSANYINGLQEIEIGTIENTNTTELETTISYYKLGRIVQITGEIIIKSGNNGQWSNLIVTTLPKKLWPFRNVVVTSSRDTDGNLIGVSVSSVSGNLFLTARGRSTLTTAVNNAIPFTLNYITAE